MLFKLLRQPRHLPDTPPIPFELNITSNLFLTTEPGTALQNMEEWKLFVILSTDNEGITPTSLQAEVAKATELTEVTADAYAARMKQSRFKQAVY